MVRALQNLGAQHAVVVHGGTVSMRSAWARLPWSATQGRRDPRMQNPSRGLRAADGLQPRTAGRQSRTSRYAAARRARRPTGPAREIVAFNAGAARCTAASPPASGRHRAGAPRRSTAGGQGQTRQARHRRAWARPDRVDQYRHGRGRLGLFGIVAGIVMRRVFRQDTEKRADTPTPGKHSDR